jgi:DNA-directed RNA polymerase subunit F
MLYKHSSNPLANQLNEVNVNVLYFRDLIQERHVNTHQKIGSCNGQKNFLDILEKFEFPDNFIYRELVENLFNLLKQKRLKRYVN